MAPKTRKSAKAAASPPSADHLHPSSAAKSKSSASPASSTTSTVNGSTTHIPVKPSDSYATTGKTWNPIKLIERLYFRTYWNIEATFSLSMLEAWEVFLVIVVFLVITLLLWYSLIYYFPRHAREVATRALYYVYGNSPPPTLAAAVQNGTIPVVEAGEAGEGVLEKLIASSNQLWASLDAERAAEKSDPEVVDRLISNLNKVKQMIANAGGKAGDAVKNEL